MERTICYRFFHLQFKKYRNLGRTVEQVIAQPVKVIAAGIVKQGRSNTKLLGIQAQGKAGIELAGRRGCNIPLQGNSAGTGIKRGLKSALSELVPGYSIKRQG